VFNGQVEKLVPKVLQQIAVQEVFNRNAQRPASPCGSASDPTVRRCLDCPANPVSTLVLDPLGHSGLAEAMGTNDRALPEPPGPGGARDFSKRSNSFLAGGIDHGTMGPSWATAAAVQTERRFLRLTGTDGL